MTADDNNASRAGAATREAALKKAKNDTGAFQKKAKDLADAHARTQAQKFEQAAREHGADGDEGAFKGVLRKLAKPKG